MTFTKLFTLSLLVLPTLVFDSASAMASDPTKNSTEPILPTYTCIPWDNVFERGTKAQKTWGALFEKVEPFGKLWLQEKQAKEPNPTFPSGFAIGGVRVSKKNLLTAVITNNGDGLMKIYKDQKNEAQLLECLGLSWIVHDLADAAPFAQRLIAEKAVQQLGGKGVVVVEVDGETVQLPVVISYSELAQPR